VLLDGEALDEPLPDPEPPLIEPDDPEEPDVPDEPDEPDEPVAPLPPLDPELPDAPELPELPELPEVPEVPEAPLASELPEDFDFFFAFLVFMFWSLGFLDAPVAVASEPVELLVPPLCAKPAPATLSIETSKANRSFFMLSPGNKELSGHSNKSLKVGI
jgi:outer membrane biosynthesis protein TonB